MTTTTREDSVNSDHYLIKGKRFVRATTLLERVGHSDFSGIPDREYYMSRGKGVHTLFEHIELGIDHKFNYDPEVEKYRPAHALFIKETGFNALKGGIEKRVQATWAQLGFTETAVEEVGMAGTLDRLGRIQGRLCLIDYKGSAVPKSTPAQTALYLIALLLDPKMRAILKDFNSVDRYGVGFTPNGYKMTLRYPDSDYHLALSLVEKYIHGEKI